MRFNDKEPIWLQIHDYVRQAIMTGRWREGERIPSVREMAASLEVNPNTVMRAYERLESEELIATRRGLGFFVAESARERSIDETKQTFLTEELPRLMERMAALGITSADITRAYENHLNTSNHENEQ